METKTNYQVGDEVRIQFGNKTEVVTITKATKYYLTCGWSYEFHAETLKCVNNQWRIVGLANPTPEKKKGLPRGIPFKKQGIFGRTPRVKTTKQ
jgi:hypothetical protein